MSPDIWNMKWLRISKMMNLMIINKKKEKKIIKKNMKKLNKSNMKSKTMNIMKKSASNKMMIEDSEQNKKFNEIKIYNMMMKKIMMKNSNNIMLKMMMLNMKLFMKRSSSKSHQIMLNMI